MTTPVKKPSEIPKQKPVKAASRNNISLISSHSVLFTPPSSSQPPRFGTKTKNQSPRTVSLMPAKKKSPVNILISSLDIQFIKALHGRQEIAVKVEKKLYNKAKKQFNR